MSNWLYRIDNETDGFANRDFRFYDSGTMRFSGIPKEFWRLLRDRLNFLTADPFISPSPQSPPVKGGEE